MRYLRMLCNSMVAAAIATAYVIVLVLDLNPALPLHPISLAPLVATVGLFYAVHLTVIFYVLLVVRQLLARDVFSPAWVSVGVLVWLIAMAAAAGALLMWRNLWTFALVLDTATATALLGGTLVLGAASALCVALALLRRSAPRARVAWAPLLVLFVAGSVATPLALRGGGTPSVLEARPIDASLEMTRNERSAHVSVIAIDAGSLDSTSSRRFCIFSVCRSAATWMATRARTCFSRRSRKSVSSRSYRRMTDRKAERQKGRKAGRQEGRKVGRQEGRKVGRQEGRKVGRQEGRRVGR